MLRRMRSPSHTHPWPRLVLCTALLVIALAAIVPMSASGATYFVDRDSLGGACSDDYSPAVAQDNASRPFCSLDALAPLVPAGSEVLVRGADYPGWSIDDASKSAYVTVRPFEGESVRTTGVVIDASDHWAIEGIELTGSDPLLASSFATGRFAVDNSSHTRIEHNNIYDALGGLYSKNRVTDLSFSHNAVHTVRCVGIATSCPDSYKSGYGVATVTGPVIDWRIAENSFSDLDGDGVQMMCTEDCEIVRNTFIGLHAQAGNADHIDALQLSGGADDFTYEGNYVADASKAVCYCSDHVTPRLWRNVVFADNIFFNDGNYCLEVAPTVQLEIRNNLCWENRYSGVRTTEDPALGSYSNVRVFNNIFGPCTECHGDSVALTPASTGVASWHNNLIVENGQDRAYSSSDIVSPGAAAIAQLFVDPSHGDFHPAPTSIAIDAGAIDPGSSISSVDADGLSRIVGTIDVGPYEYGASSVALPEEAATSPPVELPNPAANLDLEGGTAAGRTAETSPPATPTGPVTTKPAAAATTGRRPFKVLGVSRRGGAIVLRVNIPRPGHLSVRGPGLYNLQASASRARVLAMPLRPTRVTRQRLQRRGRAQLRLVLRYRSSQAPRSIRTFVELATRHGDLVLRVAARPAVRRAARP